MAITSIRILKKIKSNSANNVNKKFEKKSLYYRTSSINLNKQKKQYHHFEGEKKENHLNHQVIHSKLLLYYLL